MKVPLRLASHHHSALLQEIPVDIRTRDTAIRGERYADELPKPTGVVIPLRLCVAKRLEDRVSLQNLALKQTERWRLGDHLTESIRAVARLERCELGASGVLWDHR